MSIADRPVSRACGDSPPGRDPAALLWTLVGSQGGTLWIKITRLCCPSDNAFCPQAGPSRSPGHSVCIIDEIGKMELFSQPFIQAVRQTLSTPGTVVLGTIPVPKGKPLALVEEIRNRHDVKVFSVSNPCPGIPSLPLLPSSSAFCQWHSQGGV